MQGRVKREGRERSGRGGEAKGKWREKGKTRGKGKQSIVF